MHRMFWTTLIAACALSGGCEAPVDAPNPAAQLAPADEALSGTVSLRIEGMKRIQGAL